MTRPVRIANCSGFYGDRFQAAREVVEGGPIDVLTGDYLAELTMLILWKARRRNPHTGYARTFLRQLEDILGTCVDRGIKIVVNAGGLNPAGLAGEVSALAERLGVSVRVGHIEGDDLAPSIDSLSAQGERFVNLDTGQPLSERAEPVLTANAYLGARGIAAELDAGADIVICPRVTDASLVVGPAAWWHDWSWDSWDALAGAVAAGHIIECGPQATGGNYSSFAEVRPHGRPGFPIAEIAEDGTTVITKHPGSGGTVTVGTVTAQMMYEVAGPEYVNPDVVARFDTVHLDQAGDDRVRVHGTRGEPPPSTLKVAMALDGGARNSMTMLLTGLAIEERSDWASELLFEDLGGRDRFDEVDPRLIRSHRGGSSSDSEEAMAQLQVTVTSRDAALVGRRFSDAVTSLALAGFPGFHTSSPPAEASTFAIYWPTSVAASAVREVAVLPDGSRRLTTEVARPLPVSRTAPAPVPRGHELSWASGTVRAPLGLVCDARSGDKGGNANVGLWTRFEGWFAWISALLDVDRLRSLLPEIGGYQVRRYEFSNLLALNFVIVGLLGDGVASSTRRDPQARGLAEFVRSRVVDVPIDLLGTSMPSGDDLS